MRVLMLKRSDMLPGGEWTQIRETAAKFRERGIDVEIGASLQPDLRGVDLVHVFGLTQPAEPLTQASYAAAHGVPVALSPAHQDFSEYNRCGRYGLAAAAHRYLPTDTMAEMAKLLLRIRRAPEGRAALMRLLPVPYDEQRKRLLRTVSVVLPNSESEAAAIRAKFDHRGPMHVVPYGVSAEVFGRATPDAFVQKTGIKDAVIVAGLISSLKNQLRLIHALDGTGVHLVIAGSRMSTHAAYYREVLRAAEGKAVTILGQISHAELASAFAASRVVALPSWWETCGMAALEGVVAGCRAVVTNRGFTRDYYGDGAHYCEPGSVESIRAAVLQARDAAPPEGLRHRILTEFNWNVSAEKTLAAYPVRGIR
jgi:glycosyltransferase involved in cell wall biosynthesis